MSWLNRLKSFIYHSEEHTISSVELEKFTVPIISVNTSYHYSSNLRTYSLPGVYQPMYYNYIEINRRPELEITTKHNTFEVYKIVTNINTIYLYEFPLFKPQVDDHITINYIMDIVPMSLNHDKDTEYSAVLIGGALLTLGYIIISNI